MAGKGSSAVVAWNQAKAAPLVLVSGASDFLASRAAREIRSQLHAEDPSLEVTDLDASSYGHGALLTVASPSLFGEPRLVRVDHVEKCTDEFLADALEYLEQPAEGAVVILRHSGGNRGKKLLDALRASKDALEVACPELSKESDRMDFAKSEFTMADRKITPGALRALVTAFGDDVPELAAACAQLVADAPGDITEEIVAKYYGQRAETTAFNVADLALAGKSSDALLALRQALLSGAEPVPMLGAFAMKIRAMAKVNGRRESSAQLAGPLGMAPWQIDRARRDVEGWSDDALAALIKQVAEVDADVKGASRDPVYSLERLVLTMSRRGR